MITFRPLSATLKKLAKCGDERLLFPDCARSQCRSPALSYSYAKLPRFHSMASIFQVFDLNEALAGTKQPRRHVVGGSMPHPDVCKLKLLYLKFRSATS